MYYYRHMINKIERNIIQKMRSYYRVGCLSGLIDISAFYDADPHKYVTDRMVKEAIKSLTQKRLLKVTYVSDYMILVDWIKA